MILARFRKRSDVFARHNQHMHRRLGINVGERVALLILINGSGRNAPFEDLAEDAIHSAFSVQELPRLSGLRGSIPFDAFSPASDDRKLTSPA